LLGVTHIFEVYYGEPSNWIFNMIFSVMKAFLVFFQGFFLSVIYCFMNNEVKNKIRRHWIDKFKLRSRFFNKKRNPRSSDCNNLSMTPNVEREVENLVKTENPPQVNGNLFLKESRNSILI
jgi:hypothetical protein